LSAGTNSILTDVSQHAELIEAGSLIVGNQFDQGPAGGPGMEEGHQPTAGAAPRHKIHQFQVGGPRIEQCRRYIVDPIGDMMDAGPTLGQKFSHRTIGPRRAQQLHVLVTARQQSDLYSLILQGLASHDHETQGVLIESEALGQRWSRDADMVDCLQL
jgi:hypothetical protein